MGLRVGRRREGGGGLCWERGGKGSWWRYRELTTKYHLFTLYNISSMGEIVKHSLYHNWSVKKKLHLIFGIFNVQIQRGRGHKFI